MLLDRTPPGMRNAGTGAAGSGETSRTVGRFEAGGGCKRSFDPRPQESSAATAVSALSKSSSNCVAVLCLLIGPAPAVYDNPAFDFGPSGTFKVRVGFSGKSLEALLCCFVSGEMATPIISGFKLLLENIFGLEVSIRIGILGATFPAIPLAVPPGPLIFFSR